jgi:MraZ protein
MDKQGRILIPPALRPSAALESNVVVVGAGEWLEIWSPERFGDEMTEVDEKLGPTLELLEPRL